LTQSSIHELGFTIPGTYQTEEIPQLLQEMFSILPESVDLEAIKQPKGRNGYQGLYVLHNDHGAELVSICTGGVGRHLKHTTHVTVHGAAWETGGIDIELLAKTILVRHGWGANVHFALDTTTSDGLPWEVMKECCTFGNYRDRVITKTCKPSKDKRNGGLKQNPPVLLIEEGETIYLGKRKSKTSICMYNRRGFIRVELRLSNRASVTDVLQRIVAGEDLGKIAAGALRHNLEFVPPGLQKKGDRKVYAWWDDFLDGAEGLALKKVREQGHKSRWYRPPTPKQRIRKRLQKDLEGKNGEAAEEVIKEMAYELNLVF